MNERATRMLFAAVAISAFAAVLATTANARVPEGAVVPAEIYAASTSPAVNETHTQQTSGTFFVDPEIYSASTSPVTSEQQTPQTSGTFFVDPEIYSASTVRAVLEQQTARTSGTFGVDPEIYATLDPAIKAAIQAHSHLSRLARQAVGAVARALPYPSPLGNNSRIGAGQAGREKTAALPHGIQVGLP